MKKRIILLVIGILGFLFLSAYIRNIAVDVVYTDYIRHILTYVTDNSFTPYLKLDICTRMPITYIIRLINIKYFGYSTYFDIHLGILFLSIANIIILKYILDNKLGLISTITIIVVAFSLCKWEMLLNGTGYIHFLCIMLMVISYKNINFEKDKISYYILNAFLILMVAGPYSLPYLCSLIIIHSILSLKDFKFIYVKKIMYDCLLVFIYGFSQIYAEKITPDSHIVKLMSDGANLITKVLNFTISFILSIASGVCGVETYSRFKISTTIIFIIGLLLFATYIFIIIKIIRTDIKKYYFPLLLIFYGLFTHVFVAISRLSFNNLTYAMSSRYSLSYQIGIIGLIIGLSMFVDKKVFAYSLIIIILLGNIATYVDELSYVEARHNYFKKIDYVACHYKSIDDKTLKQYLQYKDVDKIREALKIIEQKKMNIFK